MTSHLPRTLTVSVVYSVNVLYTKESLTCVESEETVRKILADAHGHSVDSHIWHFTTDHKSNVPRLMLRRLPIIQKSNNLFSLERFQILRLFIQNQMATQRYSRVSSSCDSKEGLIPSEQFCSYRSNSKINYFWRFCLVANFLLLLCNVLFTVRRFDFHVNGTGAARNADYSKYDDQYLTIS